MKNNQDENKPAFLRKANIQIKPVSEEVLEASEELWLKRVILGAAELPGEEGLEALKESFALNNQDFLSVKQDFEMLQQALEQGKVVNKARRAMSAISDAISGYIFSNKKISPQKEMEISETTISEEYKSEEFRYEEKVSRIRVSLAESNKVVSSPTPHLDNVYRAIKPKSSQER